MKHTLIPTTAPMHRAYKGEQGLVLTPESTAAMVTVSSPSLACMCQSGPYEQTRAVAPRHAQMALPLYQAESFLFVLTPAGERRVSLAAL
jgi:hypothetical protein